MSLEQQIKEMKLWDTVDLGRPKLSEMRRLLKIVENVHGDIPLSSIYDGFTGISIRIMLTDEGLSINGS